MTEQEEAVRVFDLVVQEKLLPVKLEDLIPLSFMGQTAVDYHRSKCKAIKNLDMSEDQRAATLRDGQDAGKMLLAIEARIGELLPTPEEAVRLGRESGPAIRDGKKPISVGRPAEISKAKAHTARTIHNNPEAVDEIIKEAEANDDIPTKTAVINKVAANKMRDKLKSKSVGKPDLTEVVNKYTDMIVQINTGLDGVIDNWQLVGEEAQQTFMIAVRDLFQGVQRLKEKV